MRGVASVVSKCSMIAGSLGMRGFSLALASVAGVCGVIVARWGNAICKEIEYGCGDDAVRQGVVTDVPATAVP